MSASNIPNKDGKYERKAKRPNGTHVPDARCKGLGLPYDTAAYMRMTTEGVVLLDTMVVALGFPGRARLVEHALAAISKLDTSSKQLGARDRIELLDEALDILRLIEEVAIKLNYRDRRDALADMTASILCLARQGPVPSFVPIEQATLPALPAPAADQPKLL